MTELKRVWLAMRTWNSPKHAGTHSPVVLIVNQNGTDCLHHTFEGTGQEDQERGQANLYGLKGLEALAIDPGQLGNSSVRVGIRGKDQWWPEHFVFWGDDTDGVVQPLAVETDVSVILSTDRNEGNVSMPLRRVQAGSDNMSINQLLLLMITADVEDAGTDSPTELDVSSSGRTFVHFEIPDTPQSRQQRAQANLYFVPVSSPFTRADLAPSSVRVTIKGKNAWLPASIFLFGLDHGTGRPEHLVPLVHLPRWGDRWLSTDTSEGPSGLELQLTWLRGR